MSPDPKRIMVAGSGTSEGLFVALATPDIPKIRDKVIIKPFSPQPPSFACFMVLLIFYVLTWSILVNICKYHAEPDNFFTPLNFN